MSLAPTYRPQWLAAVARKLKRAGAFEPQAAHWTRRRGRATAHYACGCWVAWEDLEDVELPEPSEDADEFEFAQANLGRQLAEWSCRKHKSPEEPSLIDLSSELRSKPGRRRNGKA